MRQILFLLLLLSFGSLQLCYAQNGEIIDRQQLDIFSNPDIANRISEKINEKRVLHPKYAYLNEVLIEKITYLSDGLKVKGYLATPKTTEKVPCVIYNRGGNKDFGSLNDYKAIYILAEIASWGYVVAASQYRGNKGGEGKEEFGGSDVNDVLNLIPLFDQIDNADTSSMGVYGWSRGGMMTYLTLTKTNQFKAAIVGAGLSDLWSWIQTRTDTIESVFAKNIPNYAPNTKEALNSRSAIMQVDKLSKTTPILIMHGSSDWRVDPQMPLDLSSELIKENVPFRLVMFEGGDHGLREFRDEVDELSKQWLDKYLKNNHELPNLKKHGK